MWIDKKRQVETEKRKGLSRRTVIAVSMMVIGFIGAYLLTGWLFSSGMLSLDLFYTDLSIPATVGENSIRLGLVLLMVFALQFTAIIGFAVANPEARKRTGQPSVVAKDPDFFEDQYDNF